MHLKEAAAMLQVNKNTVISIIQNGLPLPRSNKIVKLKATQINSEYFIDDDDLDEYISEFEKEEPSRHPPVAIRRLLLNECHNHCPVCNNRTVVFEFHHIIEWSKIKNFVPESMIALCPTCHSEITSFGIPDEIRLRQIKAELKRPNNLFPINKDLEEFQSTLVRLDWYDIRHVIITMHENCINKFDYSDQRYDTNTINLIEKNELNNLTEDTFRSMIHDDEKYFHEIDLFLKDPINEEFREMYFSIVSDLKRKISSRQRTFDLFDDILDELVLAARINSSDKLENHIRSFRIVLSFMYFQCDIGRKTDAEAN